MGEHVTVSRRYPFHGGEKIVEFDTVSKTYVRHADYNAGVVAE
jgi:hypothetical protein